MVYSNRRKLSLSGWLQKNNETAYSSPLRLQKFLFFYEVFSKLVNETADFSRLKGYQRGPVFSPVWGDYTNDRMEFDDKALEAYHAGKDQVNEVRAKKANFIVSVLSEDELSDLTHKFHIWNAKIDRISAEKFQVELEETDFNEEDFVLAKSLEELFPDSLVEESTIVPIGERYFVFSNSDAKRLTEQHFEMMSSLVREKTLHNPVFVEIDEKGVLCID